LGAGDAVGDEAAEVLGEGAAEVEVDLGSCEEAGEDRGVVEGVRGDVEVEETWGVGKGG